LLELDQVRIDAAGGTLVDGLSAKSEAERLGLSGDWSWLFRLLSAEVELVSGRALLFGAPAERAVQQNDVGLVRHDPELPSDWSPFELIFESALLLGKSRSEARREAGRALAELGLDSMARRPLSRLGAAERRAALIAHARLAEPAVLVLELPLARLDDGSAHFVSELMLRAAAGKRLVFSVESLTAGTVERSALDQVEEVLVLRGHGVIAQGAPGSVLVASRRYSVVVSKHAVALAERLRNAGAVVHVRRSNGVVSPLQALSELELSMLRAGRLLVDLSEAHGPESIIDAALELQAPILELLPVS
jgi:ABC-type multidrug transport system ATPase subunit